MRIRKKGVVYSTRIAAVILLLCAGVAAVGQNGNHAAQLPAPQLSVAQQAESIMASTPPNELVRKMVENELNARDEGHYMYREWRQTPDGSRTKEIVETTDGSVAQLISINDQPLTPKDKTAEDARLENLLSHPEIQQQKKKEQQQDADRVKKMFKELPAAFIYQYAGIQPGRWGDLIHLTFQPNPKYSPSSRETSVYKAMSGELWIAVPETRLANIEATLFKEVSFGWGILGHLDKGGHFFVAQSRINPERWEATDMNIQFTGKALLFKTINMREIEKLSDFRRVPDQLTLAQGIDLLKKNGNQITQAEAGGR